MREVYFVKPRQVGELRTFSLKAFFQAFKKEAETEFLGLVIEEIKLFIDELDDSEPNLVLCRP